MDNSIGDLDELWVRQYAAASGPPIAVMPLHTMKGAISGHIKDAVEARGNGKEFEVWHIQKHGPWRLALESDGRNLTADGAWYNPLIPWLEEKGYPFTIWPLMEGSACGGRVQCDNCGRIIQSKWRHNFTSCDCTDDARISIDGGSAYARMAFGKNSSWSLPDEYEPITEEIDEVDKVLALERQGSGEFNK